MNASLRDVLKRVLFQPELAWPVAIIRIGFGLMLLIWSVSLLPDIASFYGESSIAPVDAVPDSMFPALDLSSAGAVRWATIAVAILSIPVIVGYRPTACLLVCFVLMAAVYRHNTTILNSGDQVLLNMTLLLAFTPSSAALSVDRWRSHGRQSLFSAPRIAPWGLRLIQLQLIMIYFDAAISKTGFYWHAGIAVSTALRLEDLQRIAVPETVTQNIPLIAMLTWGALAVEFALALMLWKKHWRPLLIVLGLSLHLFIDITLNVGLFGHCMMISLMAFLDGDVVQEKVSKVFRRDPHSGARVEARLPGPPSSTTLAS